MIAKKTILVVEDERQIRESLQDFLTMQGYDVDVAPDGESGLAQGLQGRPDLTLLDIMMPGMHGYDVCRALRAGGYGGPVIFLSAKGEEIDKLTGFDVGGDDYLTKPFSLLELHARIRALLRRADKDAEPVAAWQWGPVSVNFTTWEVTVDGEPVRLSAKEMELLRLLIERRGEVLTRELLLDRVWHLDADVNSRTLDTHILNLRRKLGDRMPYRLIQTVHGVGYKLAADR